MVLKPLSSWFPPSGPLGALPAPQSGPPANCPAAAESTETRGCSSVWPHGGALTPHTGIPGPDAAAQPHSQCPPESGVGVHRALDQGACSLGRCHPSSQKEGHAALRSLMLPFLMERLEGSSSCSRGGAEALYPKTALEANPLQSGRRTRCLPESRAGGRPHHPHASLNANGFNSFGSSFKSDRDRKAERLRGAERETDRHSHTHTEEGRVRAQLWLHLGQPGTPVHQTGTDTGQPADLEADGCRVKS